MNKDTLIKKLIARKQLLLSRNRENRNIVNKIERQLRALQAA